MGNRRNYSDATIKQLFAKSGNRCSFPGCSAFISIEIVGSGDIAHIEGKNRGSPRYNEDQSDLERDAEENIILLCQHHHKVTDDTQIYTVGVLKEMKRQHEGSIAFITGFAKQIETETVSDVAPDGTLTIRPKKIEDVIKFHETVFASSVDRTTGLPFDPAKPVYIQQLGETKVPVVFEAVSYAIITISPDAR
jgi:hypothetical protein